jgi:hypothetical protein
MRLGKIENMRCGEIDSYTFVVIPDDWSKDDFTARVRAAADAYKEALDTKPPEEPPRAEHYPNLEKLDQSLTIGDLVKERKDKEAAWTAWFSEWENLQRSFGEHLKDVGLLPVQWHEGDEFIPINWGHRHGSKMQLDEARRLDI